MGPFGPTHLLLIVKPFDKVSPNSPLLPNSSLSTGALSQLICFGQTLWQIFAKFAIFPKFAAFAKFAAFDGALLPNSFPSSNPSANFPQICRFRQIRRFPRGPLCQLICFRQTLWQSFAKFTIFAKFAAFHGAL